MVVVTGFVGVGSNFVCFCDWSSDLTSGWLFCWFIHSLYLALSLFCLDGVLFLGVGLGLLIPKIADFSPSGDVSNSR